MPWRVTRYGKEMQPGDGVILWMAGPEAGIYALAEITAAPQMQPPTDLDYWVDRTMAGQKPVAQLRFTHKYLEQPLLRRTLMQQQILPVLPVIIQPNCTNYRITPEQWQQVLQRLEA
jgi:hypothetical protein